MVGGKEARDAWLGVGNGVVVGLTASKRLLVASVNQKNARNLKKNAPRAQMTRLASFGPSSSMSPLVSSPPAPVVSGGRRGGRRALTVLQVGGDMA
jgi:hypothetical protein